MHTHPGRIDAYSVDSSICCIQCRWASKYLDFGKSSRKLTHLRLSTSSGPLDNLDAATPSTTRAKKNYSFHIFPHDIPIISFFLSFSTWFTYNFKFFLSCSTWFTYNLNLFWWFVRIFFPQIEASGRLRSKVLTAITPGGFDLRWNRAILGSQRQRCAADIRGHGAQPTDMGRNGFIFFFVKVGHIYDYIYMYIIYMQYIYIVLYMQKLDRNG